jgi:hypothetical protein
MSNKFYCMQLVPHCFLCHCRMNLASAVTILTKLVFFAMYGDIKQDDYLDITVGIQIINI